MPPRKEQYEQNKNQKKNLSADRVTENTFLLFIALGPFSKVGKAETSQKDAWHEHVALSLDIW